ncbi:MAG: hypothetical protein WB608_16245 [Terracidiphilus sp.]
MKLLRGFVLTLTLLGLGLAAHATTVAATVVDSDSTAWANGACSALYAPIPNYSGPLYNTLTGAQITLNPVSCTLNSSGVMSVTLVPSANVYGTNYNLGPSPGVIFTVCSAATGNKCYSTVPVSISGSSQDVSTQINAVIKAPRIAALLPLAQAYNDTEAPLVTGAANQYFRLSDGTSRCSANGGAWGPCNGGATTSAALTMNNSGSGAASGTTFDGSVARTISYNTIGAQPANLAATAPGDMICGLHADTSAGSQTITAGSTTGTVATLTAASVPTYFYQGQLVGVTGATPSGLNGGPYTLTAVTNGTSGHISFANASTVWTSGGTFFLWAANQVTDGNAGYTAFSNSITMAANTWGVSLNALGITEQYTVFSSSSAATVQLGLAYGGVQLYNSATALTVGNSNAGYTGWHKIALGALSPSLMMITPGPASFVTTLAVDVPGGTANPFTVDTTTTKALTPLVKFSNNTANNCLLLNDILIF